MKFDRNSKQQNPNEVRLFCLPSICVLHFLLTLRLLSPNYHWNGGQWQRQRLCQRQRKRNRQANIWIMFINTFWYCGATRTKENRFVREMNERKRKKWIHSSSTSGNGDGSGNGGCLDIIVVNFVCCTPTHKTALQFLQFAIFCWYMCGGRLMCLHTNLQWMSARAFSLATVSH